jgi:ribosomal-protein-alanine N-acetyltransferase
LTVGPIDFPEEGLSDGRIRLRLLDEDDFGRLVELANEPEVARFTTMPSPYSDAEARSWFKASSAGLRAGTDLHPLIVDAESGELLGGCGIARRAGDERVWGIGYWVAAEHRGKGYAARAVRLIVPFAFAELGIDRLELLAEEINPASTKTAEACGFTREGILRAYLEIAGERRDMVSYSLLPGEAT